MSDSSSWPPEVRRHFLWWPVRWVLAIGWAVLYVATFVTAGTDGRRRPRVSDGVVDCWLLPLGLGGELDRPSPNGGALSLLCRPWVRLRGRLTTSPTGVRWVPRSDVAAELSREWLIPASETPELETGRYSVRRSWVVIISRGSSAVLLVRRRDVGALSTDFERL